MVFITDMSFDNRIYRPVVLANVLDSLSSNELVVIVGMRGSGKSHLAREVSARFQGRHGRRSVFWLDLEDPRLAPGPTLETAEVFLKAAGETPSLVVLDEVARLEGWHRWCKQTCQKTGASVLVTLSANPRLVHSGLKDTGDAIFSIYPLSLREYLDVINDVSVDSNAPGSWFSRGGLPGIAYSPDRDKACFDLLYEILFRDVALIREIRDMTKLIDMSVYLVESSGAPVSLTSMRKHGMGSIDKTRAFLSALEYTGLVSMVDRVEDMSRKRHQAGRIVFSSDLGMMTALARGPISKRRMWLTAVYGEMIRLGEKVAAWKYQGITGLCRVRNGRVDLLVGVAGDGAGRLSWRGLATAARRYGADRVLVLGQEDHQWDMKAPGCRIMSRNLWNWLAEPNLEPAPAEVVSTASVPKNANLKPGKRKQVTCALPAEVDGGLPRYLL